MGITTKMDDYKRKYPKMDGLHMFTMENPIFLMDDLGVHPF